MDNRKLACLAAAGFLGTALAFSTTQAFAARPLGDVVVKGQKIDPDLQRRISYADLNLAVGSDQKVLKRRISSTANSLCFDLNGNRDNWSCTSDAIRSTDEQFAAAVDRAKLKIAGKPVGPAIAISMVINGR